MFGGGFHEDMGAYDRPMPPWMNVASVNRRFDEYFRCYSVAMMPGSQRENVNYGGKVILPPSALDKLTRLNITYPMLFELRNESKDRTSHAGVLEFIADEGRIYLPHWMMQTLLLEQGDLLQVKSTELPQGSFVRIQPQSTDFLDISDPKAVLENALRNFSTLTKDDVFQISYNEKIYEILVLEVKPAIMDAISVVETDLEVDFAPPLGYVEPERNQTRHTHIHTQGSMATAINYDGLAHVPQSTPFSAGGQKLSGKAVLEAAPTTASSGKAPAPLRLPFGQLFFGYKYIPPRSAQEENESVEENHRFHGDGQSLRQVRKRKAERDKKDSGGKPETIEID